MAKFEIKMIFKKSADIQTLYTEIESICKKSHIHMLNSIDNYILVGSDDISLFAPAYIRLQYSTLLKKSLLDATWKDMHGEHSCRAELMEPV